MTERSFLDSNVLLYADDAGAGAKQQKAVALLEAGFRTGRGVLSTQVLQEYYVNAVAKLGVPKEIARAVVDTLRGLELAVIQVEDVLAAIDLHRLHSLSFWDCLVVRAAQRCGCRVLYTEDLQHGRDFDGTRVINPFL